MAQTKFTASDIMRGTDEDKESGYVKVVNATIEKLREIWDNRNFVINEEYEKKLLNGRLFGTRFSADVSGDYAKEVYTEMNNLLLSRDTLSERIETALKDNKIIDLGDAVVVPHTVIVNPLKMDFKVETQPSVQLTFNLVLPEDIPEDYSMEEEEDDQDQE